NNSNNNNNNSNSSNNNNNNTNNNDKDIFIGYWGRTAGSTIESRNTSGNPAIILEKNSSEIPQVALSWITPTFLRNDASSFTKQPKVLSKTTIKVKTRINIKPSGSGWLAIPVRYLKKVASRKKLNSSSRNPKNNISENHDKLQELSGMNFSQILTPSNSISNSSYFTGIERDDSLHRYTNVSGTTTNKYSPSSSGLNIMFENSTSATHNRSNKIYAGHQHRNFLQNVENITVVPESQITVMEAITNTKEEDQNSTPKLPDDTTFITTIQIPESSSKLNQVTSPGLHLPSFPRYRIWNQFEVDETHTVSGSSLQKSSTKTLNLTPGIILQKTENIPLLNTTTYVNFSLSTEAVSTTNGSVRLSDRKKGILSQNQTHETMVDFGERDSSEFMAESSETPLIKEYFIKTDRNLAEPNKSAGNMTQQFEKIQLNTHRTQQNVAEIQSARNMSQQSIVTSSKFLADKDEEGMVTSELSTLGRRQSDDTTGTFTTKVITQHPVTYNILRPLLSQYTHSSVTPLIPVTQSSVTPTIPVTQNIVTPLMPVTHSSVTPLIPVTQNIATPSISVTPLMPVTQNTVTPLKPVTQNIVTTSIPVTQSSVTPLIPVTQNIATPSILVTPLMPVTQNTVTPLKPVTQNIVTTSIPVTQSSVTPLIPVTPQIPVTQNIVAPSIPVTESSDIPLIPVTQNTVTTFIPVTQNVITGSITVTKNTVTPTIPITQNSVTSSTPVTQNTVTPPRPVTHSSVTPLRPVTHSSVTPSTAVTQKYSDTTIWFQDMTNKAEVENKNLSFKAHLLPNINLNRKQPLAPEEGIGVTAFMSAGFGWVKIPINKTMNDFDGDSFKIFNKSIYRKPPKPSSIVKSKKSSPLASVITNNFTNKPATPQTMYLSNTEVKRSSQSTQNPLMTSSNGLKVMEIAESDDMDVNVSKSVDPRSNNIESLTTTNVFAVTMETTKHKVSFLVSDYTSLVNSTEVNITRNNGFLTNPGNIPTELLPNIVQRENQQNILNGSSLRPESTSDHSENIPAFGHIKSQKHLINTTSNFHQKLNLQRSDNLAETQSQDVVIQHDLGLSAETRIRKEDTTISQPLRKTIILKDMTTTPEQEILSSAFTFDQLIYTSSFSRPK
ncbi:hypothetical protein Ahia01_000399200, partial [Argonauta hians]